MIVWQFISNEFFKKENGFKMKNDQVMLMKYIMLPITYFTFAKSTYCSKSAHCQKEKKTVDFTV